MGGNYRKPKTDGTNGPILRLVFRGTASEGFKEAFPSLRIAASLMP
jgi:hypothetical protein